MKKPVICQLCDFSPEYPGSFADSLLFLARHCRDKMGIETLCFFPEEAKERVWLREFDRERIQYAFVSRMGNIIFNVQAILRNYDPLIFHTHFYLFDVSAVFLKLLLYRDSHIVWHFHSLAKLTFQQRIKDLIKVKLLAWYGVDQFIAVGDGVYSNSIHRGFPHERLVLIYNGIYVARFLPDNGRRRSIREHLGIPEKQFVFLLLGYSPMIKGVDIFVKGAEEMAQNSNKNALFIIVGRNETRDFVYAFPESSRLGPALRIIDPIEDFSLLLNGIDVLVSSSRSEGFGYAVVEGMAAGKLVLSSDIPGVRETYGKCKGVWLFPREDWRMLAMLMKRAQEIPSIERGSLGQANSQYVKERYSLETWTERVGEVYSTLLR